MPVQLTGAALADLRRIHAFISRDNPVAANQVTAELVRACDSLEYFPNRGRAGVRPGTRELVRIWRYVIVYRVLPERVDILRIWHGARDRSGTTQP